MNPRAGLSRSGSWVRDRGSIRRSAMGPFGFWMAVALIAIAWLGPGCRSVPAPPAIDTTQPGWKLQHGQALWTPDAAKSPIAGELLVAWNVSGDSLVQFTKTPFPFVTARRQAARWWVEWGAGARRQSGVTPPPRETIWFQLPRISAGQDPDAPWAWKPGESGSTTLTHPLSGERLEVMWDP